MSEAMKIFNRSKNPFKTFNSRKTLKIPKALRKPKPPAPQKKN
jgi:hypothetical protein